MKPRILLLWDSLRTNFWLVPALMVGLAAALAFGLVALDAAFEGEAADEVSWLYGGGPEGARAILSTVAGSVINVAGVTFSITIAVLTLASSQFGPHLPRNFMRDRGNQVVLGAFIATFTYCLLVLRTIRGPNVDIFVPQIAVTVGVGLALASFGVLIYFINHIVTMIQIEEIIVAVSRNLDVALNRLFPEQLGQEKDELEAPRGELPAHFEALARPVVSAAAGYVQVVDTDLMMRQVTNHNLVCRLACRPGDFIAPGDTLAYVYPGSRIDQALTDGINAAFVIKKRRNQTQDILFGIDQLVEIAVRALSSGINDPFTAILCIDRLGEALCLLVERKMPAGDRYDEAGVLRVLAHPVSFAEIVDAAFSPIRRDGRRNPMITLRLLKAIAAVAVRARRADQRNVLLRHAALIEQEGRDAQADSRDAQAIAEQYRAIVAIIAEHSAPAGRVEPGPAMSRV